MLYLAFFLLIVILLVLSEKSQWGSWITPLTVLAVPYTLSVILIIIYRQFVPGIPAFYFPSLTIWIIGLLLFKISSILHAKCLEPHYKQKHFKIESTRYDDSYHLLRNIAYICIGISLLKIRSLSGTLSSFGSDEFSDGYQSSSILNHLSVLSGCVFSYAIYKCDRNHKSAFIIIVGSLIGMFAIGTKSWIIAPFLIGYYARILTGKSKFSIKTTLFPLLIIILIFFFSYYLSLVIWGDNEISNEILTFIGNHFIDYCCSGALTLGIDYKMGFIEPQMTESLFAPVLNVFNALFNLDYVQVVNPVFIDVGALGSSNVRTFFGTIIAYSKNPVLYMALTLIFSFIIYHIYRISRKSQSVFLLLANTANLCFLTFGFFEFYWLNLSCYEIPIIFSIMHYIFYLKSVHIKFKVNKIHREAVPIE